MFHPAMHNLLLMMLKYFQNGSDRKYKTAIYQQVFQAYLSTIKKKKVNVCYQSMQQTSNKQPA